jgi:hypothetical protein
VSWWRLGGKLVAGRRAVDRTTTRLLAMLIAAALAGSAPAGAAAAAADCGSSLDAKTRLVARAATQTVAFAPRPAPLQVGRHFALDIVVCAREGAAPAAALRVDADMPAHRHGMNYRPTVQPLAEGRWRADGLMLHMPGRWRISFDLDVAGGSERVAVEVDVP